MALGAKTENVQDYQREAAYFFLKKLMENPGSEQDEKDVSEDGKAFRDKTSKEITERDEEYTKLLKHFVGLTKVRNILKEFFKWTFYLTLIGYMICAGHLTYSLVKEYLSKATIDQITEAVPLLLTAMGGFVSVIIVIPVTITKYLFSTEEDKNITEIISHTQSHDLSGRQWVSELLKLTRVSDTNMKEEKEEIVGNIQNINCP